MGHLFPQKDAAVGKDDAVIFTILQSHGRRARDVTNVLDDGGRWDVELHGKFHAFQVMFAHAIGENQEAGVSQYSRLLPAAARVWETD